MFDENQKKAYESIKAPDGLLERIVSSAEESKKDNVFVFRSRISRIAAAAACIVCVAVAAFTVFSQNGIEINVNGTEFDENVSIALAQTDEPALARAFSPAEVSVSLDLDGGALLTVDSGSFDVIGEDDNLTEFSADEDVELIWKSDGMKKSVMTVDYGRKSCILILEYDGEWKVTRK
jgi:hypothetical protein